MDNRVCKACGTEKSIEDFRIKAGYRRWTCSDCDRERNNRYSRDRNKRDREKVNARNAKWVSINRGKRREQQKRYREDNAERLRESEKRCRSAKPDQYREAARIRAATRRATDLDFKLKDVLRKRVRNALLGAAKAETTMSLLGCSVEDLKAHLESQFENGMNWDNHGIHGWHIDHIKPCSSFDLTDPEQQKECFHFSNLQPLWAQENWNKGNKVAA